METAYFPPVGETVPGDCEINRITGGIINSGFHISNELGVGFLEKVYRNAVGHHLETEGFQVNKEHPVKVLLADGFCAGEYFADLLVNEKVLVELKVAEAIHSAHVSQILNYLRASRLRFGLILNFGHPKMQIRRVVNGY